MGNELSQEDGDGEQVRPVPQVDKPRGGTNKKHADGHQGIGPFPPRPNHTPAVYHPQVDLSRLSEEEQAKILSVMALAEDLDTDLTTQHWKPIAKPSGGVSKQYQPCALCQVPQTLSQCTRCQTYTCMKCGSSQHSLDDQDCVWLCTTCFQSTAKPSDKQENMYLENINGRSSQQETKKIKHPSVSDPFKVHQPLLRSNVEPTTNAVTELTRVQQPVFTTDPKTCRIQHPILGTAIELPKIQKPVLVTSAEPSRIQQPVLGMAAKSRQTVQSASASSSLLHFPQPITNQSFVKSEQTTPINFPRDKDVTAVADGSENVHYDLDGQVDGAEDTLSDADHFNIVPSLISYKTDGEDEEYEKEGEEEEEEDSDEELDTPSVLQPLVFFDRSPGEVYTIPEEDDEPLSPTQSRMAGSDLNSDTASSLIRWRGMGQSYRRSSELTAQEISSSDANPTNRIGHQDILFSQQVCGANINPLGGADWQQHSKAELRWIQSGGKGQNYYVLSGDPSLSTTVRSICYSTPLTRTVPLTSVSEYVSQEEENPSRTELQEHEKQNTKPDTEGWSLMSDLSPVTDREKGEHVVQTSIPRATSGTISGMIADFNKAIGISRTSPTEHKLGNVSPRKSLVSELDVKSKSLNTIPLASQNSEEYQISSSSNTNFLTPVHRHLPQLEISTRRVHRRLPQPTVEQMQAAVAMAPKGECKDSTDPQNSTITTEIPVTSAQQDPSSGVVKDKNQLDREVQVTNVDLTTRMDPQIHQEDSFSKEHPTNQKATVSTHSVESHTFLTCRASSPLSTATMPSADSIHILDGAIKKNMEPPHVSLNSSSVEMNFFADEMDKSVPKNTEKVGFNHIDSSSHFSKLQTEHEANQPPGTPKSKAGDAQNEDGNTVFGKVRRKLPFLPQDQKSSRRGKDRSRNLSIANGSLYFMNKRRSSSLDSASSTDDLISETLSDNSMKQFDTFISEMSGQPSSASVSPKKQTSQTHSSSYLTSTLGMSEAVSQRLGLAELSLVSSRLPKYMQNLKQQLRGELRSVTEERKRLLEIRDKSRDLASILPPFWFENPATCVYTGTTHITASPSTGTVSSTQDLLRKPRHHKHHTLLQFSPIKDIYDMDPSEVSLKVQHVTRKPVKALEFECVDQFLNYEHSSWEQDSSELKEYVISDNERYKPSRDETEDWSLEYLGNIDEDSPRRRVAEKISRQPRSWHPSPYVSEDEDDQTSREEMKTKIKNEIARRRQRLEEDCRLYDQLHKIARERDTGKQTGYPPSQSTMCGASSSIGCGSETYRPSHNYQIRPSDTGSTRNVLKAIDEILKKGIVRCIPTWSTERSGDSKPLYTTAPSAYSLSSYEYLTHTGAGLKRPANEQLARFREKHIEDENIEIIDSSFSTEELASKSARILPQRHPRSECMSDVKKIDTPGGNKEITPAMPLLPDLPARSRKLLENLGCSSVVSQDVKGHHYDQAFRGYSEKPIAANLEDRCYVKSHQVDKAQNFVASKVKHKYEFPVKRILLTSDRKEGSDSGNGLGMKIAGGREIPGSNGMIGAFIVEVSPGGVVETLGEVQEGDLVLEWNGIPLTGRTYDDVQRITKLTREEVEIVIQRMEPQAIRNEPETTSNHKHEPRSLPSSFESGDKYLSSSSSHSTVDGLVSKEQHRKDFDSNVFSKSGELCLPDSQSETRRLPNVVSTCNHHLPLNWTGSQNSDLKSNSLSENNKYRFKADHITGEIELQICYDSKVSVLYVTIIRARHLVTARDNSGLPDPFVKCFLFPVRCSENQKRTRYFSRCSCPEWKQTMMYPNMASESLSMSFLEISVWNYDIHRPNEFLGEIILDLSDQTVLHEQPRWFKLQPYDENHHLRYSAGFPRMSYSHSSFTKEPPGGSEHSFSPRSIEDNRQHPVDENNVSESEHWISTGSTQKGSNQQRHNRVPRFPPNYFTAYCFIPPGCYNAVCCIFGPLFKMCPFLKKKFTTAADL